MPAKRNKCHASAWLLDVTGLPRYSSAGSMTEAARKFVHETNTPSHSLCAPIILTDSRIEFEVILPTTKSSDSKRKPLQEFEILLPLNCHALL